MEFGSVKTSTKLSNYGLEYGGRKQLLELASSMKTVLKLPSFLSVISTKSEDSFSFQSSVVDEYRGGGFGSNKMKQHAKLLFLIQ